MEPHRSHSCPIDGAESRKALLGQAVTALEFRLTDTDVGFVELAQTLECSVVAENFAPRSDGGTRRFMTTRGAESSAVLESGSVLPATNLTLVSEYESVEETVLEHGGRPRSLRVEGGAATVVVELAADAAVREFVDLFQSRFPSAELIAQRATQRPRRSPAEQRATLTEALTDRQLEAVQTA